MSRSDSVHSLGFFIIYTFRIHLAEKERSTRTILISIVLNIFYKKTNLQMHALLQL